MLQTTIGEKRNPVAVDELIKILQKENYTGSLYIGYPILVSSESTLFVDALITCQEHGVIAFHFSEYSDLAKHLEDLTADQNQLYTTLEIKLKQYKPLLAGRSLSFPINVISIIPGLKEIVREENLLVCGPDFVIDLINEFQPIGEDILWKINATVQRVTTIKPTRKRTGVTRENSLGAIIKKIDGEIANLDQWQKNGAIEFPEGVQRIRGLAGSGKTIVLALKAAYLHSIHPEWDIAITFHTRALSQQIKDLIRRFTFEHLNDEPDWDKIKVIHTWGSSSEPGIYSEIASAHGITPKNFTYGRAYYSYERAFEGVCEELIKEIGEDKLSPLYDAVLIDEAQDLPQPFFELVYLATRHPHRIIYAYDELQNLSDYVMSPPSTLFGNNQDGTHRVPELRNEDGQPKQDIVLPICYRNSPWTLSVAHALGFGIYRENGLANFFENPELLKDVGYEVMEGKLEASSNVRLRRRQDSAPKYFYELLDPKGAIEFRVFPSNDDQAKELARNIKENLTHDELEFRDILVIICDPLTAKEEAAKIILELGKRGIPAHLAGVTTSRDILFRDESVAVTNIYRAKGNEAPMVYVVNADYGFDGLELSKRRNILFTALTRSKAWVKVYGCGPSMQGLIDEVGKMIENNYEFRFTIPTPLELDKIRKIHRDRTKQEREEYEQIESTFSMFLSRIQSGDLDIDSLPKDLREQFRTLFGGTDNAN